MQDQTNSLQDIYRASDYERVAKRMLDPAALAYIMGGSGFEKTLKANKKSLSRIQLMPRALVDCTQGSTKVDLLGESFRHPIFLAPVAAQKLVHPDGEIATAQAANALDSNMIVSSLSSCALEDVATASSQRWFQLYFQKNRQETLALVNKAQAAGFSAIVVTVDTPIQSISQRAQQHEFKMSAHAQPVNLSPLERSEKTLAPDDSVIFQGLMSEAPSWSDVKWLKEQTSLPVLIKGAVHTKDIDKIIDLGLAGLVVSNHGGRALDGMPASIGLLENIRKQVGQEFPLLFDGGIRSGYDIFKALALGADAVCVGRLQMYALAVNGAQGVAHMLKLLRDELELCMALTGCPTVAAITPDSIYKE